MAGAGSTVQQCCQQHRPNGKSKELRHSSKQEIGVQNLEESAQMRWGRKKVHKVEELRDFARLKGQRGVARRCLCLDLETFAFASLEWGIYVR